MHTLYLFYQFPGQCLLSCLHHIVGEFTVGRKNEMFYKNFQALQLPFFLTLLSLSSFNLFLMFKLEWKMAGNYCKLTVRKQNTHTQSLPNLRNNRVIEDRAGVWTVCSSDRGELPLFSLPTFYQFLQLFLLVNRLDICWWVHTVGSQCLTCIPAVECTKF